MRCPDFAMTHYNVRAPKMSQAKEIFSRIVDIAKGAALMTGTSMEYHVCGGMYDYVPNGLLSKAIKAMQDPVLLRAAKGPKEALQSDLVAQ